MLSPLTIPIYPHIPQGQWSSSSTSGSVLACAHPACVPSASGSHGGGPAAGTSSSHPLGHVPSLHDDTGPTLGRTVSVSVSAQVQPISSSPPIQTPLPLHGSAPSALRAPLPTPTDIPISNEAASSPGSPTPPFLPLPPPLVAPDPGPPEQHGGPQPTSSGPEEAPPVGGGGSPQQQQQPGGGGLWGSSLSKADWLKVWALVVLSATYVHQAATSYSLPIMMPMISGSLDLSDVQVRGRVGGLQLRASPPTCLWWTLPINPPPKKHCFLCSPPLSGEEQSREAYPILFTVFPSLLFLLLLVGPKEG